MWYTAGNYLSHFQIGYAESYDGLSWSKYNSPETNEDPYANSDPVLYYDTTGIDRTGPNKPSVIITDSGYEMYYTGWDLYQLSICFASSNDGIVWTKYHANPIISELPSWTESREFWEVHALKYNDITNLWFSAPQMINGGDYTAYSEIGFLSILGDAPYCESLFVKPTYFNNLKDTLVITAKVENPRKNNIFVWAIIYSEDNSRIDSVQLQEMDNIWTGDWHSLPGEYNCSVGLSIRDSDLNFTYNSRIQNGIYSQITSAGPLRFEGYSIVTPDYQDINPGETHRFKFNIKNIGKVLGIKNVTAKVTSLDTFTTVLSPSILVNFGDITAGQSVLSSNMKGIKFSSNFSGPIDTVYFGLDIYSNGILYWQDSSVAVIVGIDYNKFSIPFSFSMKQNYPNPFNPATTIEFTLPRPEFTSLKIYNILGAEIATLVSDNLPAGLHKYNFNGSKLASGVYYYQVTAGEFRDEKKMILLGRTRTFSIQTETYVANIFHTEAPKGSDLALLLINIDSKCASIIDFR